MAYGNLKYRAKKSKFLWSLVWIPIVLIVLPVIEQRYHTQMESYSTIFYIVSFGFGVYYTYVLTMWIDSKLRHSDFHIWLRRIVAGIMVLVAIFLFIGVIITSAVAATAKGFYNLMGVSYLSFMSLMAGISIGLILFSSYLMFRYMRQSGYIIYAR